MTPPPIPALRAAALVALLLPSLACSASVVDDALMDDFFARLGDVTVTVHPAYVRGGAEDGTWLPGEGERLAAFLRDAGLAREVLVAAEPVPLAGAWQRNQAAMWTASARSFAEHVAAHPGSTEFAVVHECLMGAGEAVGVHAYVVNTKGDVVWGCHLNAHAERFEQVAPETPAECTDALILFLQDNLRPAP